MPVMIMVMPAPVTEIQWVHCGTRSGFVLDHLWRQLCLADWHIVFARKETEPVWKDLSEDSTINFFSEIPPGRFSARG